MNFFKNQNLFSQNYLDNRFPQGTLWSKNEYQVREAFDSIKTIYTKIQPLKFGVGEEALLEDKFIRPVLEALGFIYYPQPRTQRGKKPDYALFASPNDLKEARREKDNISQLYHYALTICEAKYWNRPLNDTDPQDTEDRRDATAQLVRYLDNVHYLSSGKIEWGVLTNGKLWRLFYFHSSSRSGNYYEVDLEKILQEGTLDDFKYFFHFFSKSAFLTDTSLQKTWLKYHLNESELYRQSISEKLKDRIFEHVFEHLAEGFLSYRKTELKIPSENETEDSLNEIFQGCLTLLYRLLFLLYAESRELLPVHENRYFQNSLTKFKQDILDDIHKLGSESLSIHSYVYWEHLQSLFRIVDKGDKNLNVPTYNGGLFHQEKNGFIDSHKLSDPYLVEAIQSLTVEEKAEKLDSISFIDYSSLGVRHLGDIYEGLLEFHLRIAQEPMAEIKDNHRFLWVPLKALEKEAFILRKREKGKVYIENDRHERKTTGSYFTPPFIVKTIVEHAVGPALDEKLEKIKKFISEYESLKKQYKKSRGKTATFFHGEMGKKKREIFDTLFSLKILDPAMGSGHFLVYAVDSITDRIISFLAEFPHNPVVEMMEGLKKKIIESVHQQGVTMDASKLTEVNMVKRMVMKRCIYGVDLNPMAVELAKLSLWLDSFTLGAPLSFLDHHLKQGNSLIGVRDVSKVIVPNSERYHSFQIAMRNMVQIQDIFDLTIQETEKSNQFYQVFQKNLEPFKRRLNITLSTQFFTSHINEKLREILERAAFSDDPKAWFNSSTFSVKEEREKHHIQNSIVETKNKETNSPKGRIEDLYAEYQKALSIASDYQFFHWKLEFPEVWYEETREKPDGGFDAVIGNPPWERVKLQEKEFFNLLSLDIAFAPTGAKRKELIRGLPQTDPALWKRYEEERGKSERISNYFRACGYYPLMSGGDTNYYSIFSELGLTFLNDQGRWGMVVPSGIATDKTSDHFFQDLINQKRLSLLMDFENRKGWFSNVHRSFKFSIVVASGKKGKISSTQCAFYLHDPEEMNNPERVFDLTPSDFELFNPNTKTCPIFRTRKDLEITRSIYSKVPVLIHHNKRDKNPWKIRFDRMFDMTNDSRHFKTAKELIKEGFWLSAGNIYVKGKEKYLPLYEGKMVQLYDHRAACVLVNPKNLKRPALPRPTTEPEYKDPQYSPTPQFWVPEKEVSARLPSPTKYFISFKNVCSPTNIRTMIATLLPLSGVGNSQPLVLTRDIEPKKVACLLANLSAFVLDYATRQKVGGQNLNFFIVEQLPVLSPECYENKFHGILLQDFIVQRVLELVYTSYDIQAFAQDLGYSKKPFTWDEKRRIHLRCQLNALYFLLYGTTLDQVDYMMDSFSIVQKEDTKRYGGYRTKFLIENYYKAYQAGNMDAWVKG